MKIKESRFKAAKLAFRLSPGALEEVDLTECAFIPQGMTRALRNNRYTVMIYDDQLTTHGRAVRVMIQKHDDTPIAFHWKEIQAIKNEVFGTGVTAVEYYPQESEVIDDHCIYWIWIYPHGVLPLPIL